MKEKFQRETYYANGLPVYAGDILGPGHDADGHRSRVVVVVDTGDCVDGYEISEWKQLLSGIIVEEVNANGMHLVHYPELDEDIELLERSPKRP